MSALVKKSILGECPCTKIPSRRISTI